MLWWGDWGDHRQAPSLGPSGRMVEGGRCGVPLSGLPRSSELKAPWLGVSRRAGVRDSPGLWGTSWSVHHVLTVVAPAWQPPSRSRALSPLRAFERPLLVPHRAPSGLSLSWGGRSDSPPSSLAQGWSFRPEQVCEGLPGVASLANLAEGKALLCLGTCFQGGTARARGWPEGLRSPVSVGSPCWL